MAINYDKLMNLEFPEVEQAYTPKDTMLYGLGLGLGMDPLDEAQLRFVYEKELLALPTMAAVLGHPGFWAREPGTGLEWVRILHGEQSLIFHDTLPPEGAIRSRSRITQIVDKGADRGALLFLERDGVDTASGRSLFTARQTIFARGDGGFGGPEVNTPPPHPIPERAPEEVCDLPTLPQAALIYRLSGDDNPLHADPAVAAQAGYEAPILHGLCTFGVAGHALLKTFCGYDPARMKAIQVRFSAPVYPGETLRTEMWRDGPVVSFRTRVVERDIVVLNNGRAEVTP
ncbi:MAG: MaoC/PaaZ C-terminal domain-containing protein [bacterium]